MFGLHPLTSTKLKDVISMVFKTKLQTLPLAKKNIVVHAKVFQARESLLTNLLADNTHLKTVYNLIISFFMVFVVSVIGNHVTNPKDFYEDIACLQWAFSDFHLMALGWLILHFSIICLFFPAVKLRLFLIHKTSPKFWPIINNISVLFYVSFVVAEFLVSLKCISFFRLSAIATFALLVEKTRLIMKCHSFVVETFYPVVTTFKDKKQFQLPQLQHFLYFLVAPTLIYRDCYPRTDKIRWRFVTINFIGFILTIFCTFSSIRRFLNHNFSKSGVEPFQLESFFLKLMIGFFMGATQLFLIFWGFLHCWHNAFAELLRFADRHFYSNWWNSTSISQFHRKWNVIVQDWLYAYVYLPTARFTNSKTISNYLVILFSAVFHEYLLAVPMGFFFPILFVSFSIIGYIMFLLSKTGVKISFDVSNTLILSSLFFGWEVQLVLYAMEWYSRVNCPSQLNSYLDYVTPRFFGCVSVL